MPQYFLSQQYSCSNLELRMDFLQVSVSNSHTSIPVSRVIALSLLGGYWLIAFIREEFPFVRHLSSPNLFTFSVNREKVTIEVIGLGARSCKTVKTEKPALFP